MTTVAIRAVNLVKRYRSVQGFIRKRVKVIEALKGVSFEVKRGEVFGLLGPNGAGKTTTVKIISTVLLPDEGRAYVMGYDVVDEADEVRRLIGVSFSVETGYWFVLSGRENLMYFGMLRGMRGEELRRRVDEVLKLVGLEDAADRAVEEYSLGMRARLALARALLHDPEVLILDEPTVGLDPPTARRIRRLLVELAHEHGKTVFITTHNMFEAETICDRVAIIHSGVIKAIGTPAELKRKVVGYMPVVIEGIGNVETAKRVLKETLEGVDYSVTEEGDRVKIRVLTRAGEEEKVLAMLVSKLVERGFRVFKTQVEEPSLEDVFIKVVGSSR